jgi:ribokinase
MADAGEVLVVGSINVDLVVRAGSLPARGETVSGGTFARYQGGKGANQAVAAARLGARVVMVGAVGDDEFGRSAIDDLRREGVDVSRVAVLNGQSTGIALIVVDERGDNQIAVASGANAAFDGPAALNALIDFEPRPGSVALLSFELGDSAVLAAAKLAAQRGLRLVVNPAPARPISAELLALSPIVLPNAGEAQALGGESDPRAAAISVANQTHAAVIVTIGADGALVVDPSPTGMPSTVEHIPASKVDVVDTTGAGDAFCGAFAAELAAGKSVTDAAGLAVRSAGLSVTVAGARGGMPTRASVESSRQ